MKKRLLTGFAGVITAFSIMACSNATSSVRDTISESTIDQDVTELETETEESPEEEDITLSMGSSSGYVYENTYFGMGAEFDETWSLMSDEELAEINGLVMDTAESLHNNSSSSEYIEIDTYHDMYATHESGNTVNVFVQSMGGESLSFTEDEIAEFMANDFRQNFEAVGISDVVVSVNKVSFLDEEKDAVIISAEAANGRMAYTTNIFFVKKAYLVNISATTYDEDQSADILERFYIVE